VTIAIMMAAWVTGLVFISKTYFMTTEMENRTTEAQSRASETKSAMGADDTDDGIEGSRREESECRNIWPRDNLPSSWKGS
jgi:hypothetical protein